MATTKAPLFGLDASGSIADSIVFSKWRGRTYVRRHARPSNPKSGLQLGMRSVFKYITQAWSSLTTAEQDEWAALAAADNITYLNAQVRDSQRRARLNQGWRLGPNEAAATSPDAPTGVTATAQPKSLLIEWTRPLVNQGQYTVAVYVSTSTGFTADISTLRVVLDVATTEATIIGLETGTPYFVLVRETNDNGDLGTVSAEATGTPT